MNNFKISFFLAWRNLFRNKRRSLITTFVIAIGLFLSLVYVSISDGVYYKIVQDAVKMQAGHIVLENPNYSYSPSVDLRISKTSELANLLKENKNIEGLKELIKAPGVIRSGYNSFGIQIFGIDPDYETKISKIAKKIIKGEYLSNSDENLIVISYKLAKKLKTDIGKKIVLTSNDIHGVMVEDIFRVKAIFKTNAEEVDNLIIQIPIESAQSFFGMKKDELTRIGIMLKNPQTRDKVIKDIKDNIPANIALKKWEEILPTLFSYVKSDRFMALFFMWLLIFLILFTFLNTSLMSALEREKEFSMVLAIGTPPLMLKTQVLLENCLISTIGSLIGSSSAFFVYLYLKNHGLDLSSFMPEGASAAGFSFDLFIFPKLEFHIAAKIILITLLASALMSFFSIRKIKNIKLTRRN